MCLVHLVHRCGFRVGAFWNGCLGATGELGGIGGGRMQNQNQEEQSKAVLLCLQKQLERWGNG